MKLYKLSTKNCSAYVVAEDAKKASEILETWMDENDYDFHDYRKVLVIELIADTKCYSISENNGYKKLFIQKL